MRVLQLIDSLEPGGAERVAVNIANKLSIEIEKSFICATRKQGILKSNLTDKVNYLFLNKKRTLDYRATKNLLNYINDKKIDIIHAHSSSFFLAVLIKLFRKKTHVIWHDHYGNSEYLKDRSNKVLYFCSKYFSHIFCVNGALVDWNKENLKSKSVSFLPNFAVKSITQELTILKGKLGKRILCLANLRPQKDHKNLLKAFKLVSLHHPEWTLHCVGNDFEDAYSKDFFRLIEALELTKIVFFYGSKLDTDYIISQADIGVLASKSEGLPLTLLEYGLGRLAVVTTNVGDCSKVITNDSLGQLITKSNYETLASALIKYIENKKLRNNSGHNLYTHIQTNFSNQSTIKSLIYTYKKVQGLS